MKIDLTRTEFRRLLHLVYIAAWILDAHRTADDPRTALYNQLEQKLLAIAHRHDFHDLVEYAPEHDRYFPTRHMEEGPAHQFIDEYDNDTFWDELTHRLAERDAIADVGDVDAYLNLTFDERLTRLFQHEARYADEFHEHGLDRLTIHTDDNSA